MQLKRPLDSELWKPPNLTLPPRSRLHSLEPVGSGTWRVESLTGYIARLAESHTVTTEALFGIELVPLVNRPYLNILTKSPRLMFAFHRAVHGLNGMGALAEDWSTALETLTLRKGLRFLTMLTWRYLITDLALLRKTRAWCSMCYDEQLRSNSPVYDQLLWTLEEVKVCPRHLRGLGVRCPLCNRESIPFTRKMRVGHCSHCGEWLGSVRGTVNTEEAETVTDLAERVETATMIGEMLANAPNLKNLYSKEHLSSSLNKYIRHFPPHCLNIYANLIKVSPHVVSGLANGDNRIRLGVLIRICRAFKCSVLDFLNGNKADAANLLRETEALYVKKKNEAASVKIEKRNSVIRHMQAALKDPNRPTVKELAKQLGFKSSKSLRLISAELCKKVAANSKVSRPTIGPKYSYYPDHVRVVLVNAMSEEPPPTVKEVSLRASYKDEVRFREKHPDIVKFLMDRRKEYVRTELSKIEDALLAALKEEPPPRLKEVCERLTYKGKPFKSVQNLSCKFPALCREISARYKRRKAEDKIP